jgi:hypothetical protein
MYDESYSAHTVYRHTTIYMRYFRELEYRIENASTFLNILLPVMIYGVTGAGLFGLQMSSLFSLIIGIIWGLVSLILTSAVFIQVQMYLHRIIMNLDRSESEGPKVNSIITNIVTIAIMTPLFIFVPPIRHIFSYWALPLSLSMYLIRAPNLPIHQFINLTRRENEDSRYDYFHLETPLTIGIALACGIESLFTVVPIISALHILALLFLCTTETVDYSYPRTNVETIDIDRIFRPVVRTHHLIYAANSLSLSVGSYHLILFTILNLLLIWLRDRYLRIIDTPASTYRLQWIESLRTYHNSFYRFWSSTFEVSKISNDNRLNIFIDIAKWVVFYPIHLLLAIVSNILAGRKKHASLYIGTLNLIISVIASIPIQTLDRYYLGVLFILYGMMDDWTSHIIQILNVDNDGSPESSVEHREFNSVISDHSISEIPASILTDAGISEDAASELSENVVLSEVTDESTVISMYQNRPVEPKKVKRW